MLRHSCPPIFCANRLSTGWARCYTASMPIIDDFQAKIVASTIKIFQSSTMPTPACFITDKWHRYCSKPKQFKWFVVIAPFQSILVLLSDVTILYHHWKAVCNWYLTFCGKFPFQNNWEGVKHDSTIILWVNIECTFNSFANSKLIYSFTSFLHTIPSQGYLPIFAECSVEGSA